MSHSELLRELYPTLTETELREAEQNLRRYFKIALSICGEQFTDQPDGPVDSADASSSMEERSNASLKG